MAEIAMMVAGRLAVPLVNLVLKKAYNFLSEDTKAKIRTLETTTLPRLKALIEDARTMGEEESRSLLQLLIELKTIAYETEDVIDKVEYKLLEQQAMGKLKKFVSKFPSIFSNLALEWKMSGILKELEANVSSMNDFIGSLVVSNTRNNNNIQRATRTTTVSTLSGRVIGRHAEREHIVNFLTATTTLTGSDTFNLKVVAILGVGGVGKTVLASYVFDDNQIHGHFGLKMWLHVPENFHDVKMTKSMIDLIPGGGSFDSDDLEVLQNELGRRLSGEQNRRLLLVLDDVWYDEKRTLHENKERWSKLCAPLSKGGQGSMILITSRMEKVARLFPGDTMLFFLKGLKEKDCLTLFNEHAFGAGDPPPPSTEEEEDRKNIAKEIVAEISIKLGGLPLAVSVAGDLLRHSPERRREIKRNIIQGDVRNSLMWSYRMLHPDLQHCIAHLSLYPRGFKFHPTSLALSWLGTGVVTEDKLEAVRCKYFDELVSRSFFQHAGDESFVLHSLLHDVADTVSVNECMRITRNAENARIPQTIKHLSIEVEMLGQYQKDICELKKLRTLFLTCNNSCSDSRSVAIVDRDVL